MKTRLADVLDGAAWTLVVAGSVGLSTAVMGQTSPYSTLDRPRAISSGVEDAKNLQQTAKSSRVTEMKVELAWLADSVTSPCRLEARVYGGTIEVHGQVPNEAVLGHALHMAGAESGLRVVNKVQLNPGLRAPSGGKPQEVLHQEVFNALRQGFPDKAPSIAISTLPGGEITLKGTIPTYEDKLAISRHLRQTTACSCIINQLQVLTEPQGNRTPGGAQAATLLTPEPLKSKSIQPVAYLQRSESMLPPAAVSTPNGSGGTATSSGSAPSVKSDSSGSKSTASTESSNPHPVQGPQTETETKPPSRPVVYRTKWRRLDPSEVTMSSKVVPVGAWKDAGTRPQDVSPAQSAGRIINPPHTEETTALPQQPLAAGASRTQPLDRPNIVASVKPPPSIPPAEAKAVPAAKGEPYVTEGVVIIDSMIKPASHAMPATASSPPKILKTGPYVTNGVIVFSDPADQKLLQTNPALAALQTHLQQRIAAVCGKPNRDVEVKAITETEVAVRVKANSTLEGEDLSNRIFQLPELGPCQVSLDVLVMK